MNAFSDENSGFGRRVNLYLDGALSKEEHNDFLKDIKGSPKQIEQLEEEKKFRNFLKAKLTKKRAPASLAKAISEQINLRMNK